eukprot:gb/GECG01012948.1/.p1 GENE.gb/GECG01012948.1/~~gb/GECG01012948.1/.p1  ORF type:complete len:1248 (+),score=212.02 gb/GECG01012948.1/:1-3744(+)
MGGCQSRADTDDGSAQPLTRSQQNFDGTDNIPAEETVNQMLENVMDELAIPEGSRASMVNQPLATKWQIVQAQQSRKERKDDPTDSHTPESYIESLRRYSSQPDYALQFSSTLKAQLRTCEKAWLDEFIEKDGLDALQDFLLAHERNPRISLAVLDAIKSAMKVDSTLMSVSMHEGIVGAIAIAFLSETDEQMKRVLELLTVIAVNSEDGHEMVDRGVGHLWEESGTRHKFECFMNVLQSAAPNWELKSMTLALFNVLLGVDSLEDRVTLRNEMILGGVTPVLGDLRNRVSGKLNKEGLVEDDIELSHSYEEDDTLYMRLIRERIDEFSRRKASDDSHCTFDGTNLSDFDSVYELAKNNAYRAASTQPFLSILRFLAALPSTASLSGKFWDTIKNEVSAIAVGEDDSEQKDNIILLLELDKELSETKQERDKLKRAVECYTARGRPDTLTKIAAANAEEVLPQRHSSFIFQSCVEDISVSPMATASPPPSTTVAGGVQSLTKSTAVCNVDIKEQKEGKKSSAIGGANGSNEPVPSSSFPSVRPHAAPPRPQNFPRALSGSARPQNPRVPQPMPVHGMRPQTGDGQSQSGPSPADNSASQSGTSTTSGSLPQGAPRPRPSSGGVRPVPAAGVRPQGSRLASSHGPRPSARPPGSNAVGPPVESSGPRPRPPRPQGDVVPRPAPSRPPRPQTASAPRPAATSRAPRPRPGAPLKPGAIGDMSASQQPVGESPDAKPVIRPSVKMRGVFWSKLNEKKATGTVWKDISEENTPIDTGELEALFAAEKAKEANVKSGNKKDQKQKKSDKTTLLDAKTQQNVGIALARLKLSPSELQEAVEKGDENVLSSERLEMLENLHPSPEVLEKLKSFTGDRRSLGKVEQFYYATMEIPLYEEKIRALHFKQRFPELQEKLDGNLDLLRSLCSCVRDAASLKRALEYVLAIGNYLNGNTSRGRAHGFKVDAFMKLSGVKSTDSGMNLYDYLARLALRNNETSLLELPKELKPLKTSDELSLEVLQSDLQDIRKQAEVVIKLNEKLKGDPNGYEVSDTFAQQLDNFAQSLEQAMSNLQLKYTNAKDEFESLVKYFGESSRTAEVSDFFKYFCFFRDELDKAIKRERDRREKENEKKNQNKENVAEKPVAPPSSRKPYVPSSTDGDNLVDKIYSSFKHVGVNAHKLASTLHQRSRRSKWELLYTPFMRPNCCWTFSADLEDGSQLQSPKHSRGKSRGGFLTLRRGMNLDQATIPESKTSGK